jgi:tetratricopeptide (TPR) repeat protein
MSQLFNELRKQAGDLFDEGKYSEAEPILRNILEARPDYPDVLNKLGVISYLKGDIENATGFFERAVKLNPNYTEASLNLAIAFNEKNEFKKAWEVFSRAAQIAAPAPAALDPYAAGKLANEHYKLGNMYMDLGLADESIEEYKKALRLHDGLADVRTRLGIALRGKGLLDDAVAQFSMAKESNPRYGQAWVQLGLTYYIQGFPGLAVEEWEEALRKMPHLKEAGTYLKLIKDKGKL